MNACRDPRLYQLTVLAGLLAYGVTALDFDIGLAQIALTLVSVVGMQWVFASSVAGAKVDPRSALISGLSLCLLLRTDNPALVFFAALVAIGSKFVIRVRGKHVFNPTNLALVTMLVVGGGTAWISPGQWGNVVFFAVLMASLGGLVVHRALRSDVALAFISVYAALLVGRSFYLGEPLAIPFHRLQSGALLLFTFFMISDPRTTPDSRAGRFVFAALVAFGAWYVQFRLFRTNGLLWSLAACSPLVPLLDWFLPGRRYVWPGHTMAPGTSPALPAPAAGSAGFDSAHSPVPHTAAAERMAS